MALTGTAISERKASKLNTLFGLFSERPQVLSIEPT
jgi:hypothetical protein